MERPRRTTMKRAEEAEENVLSGARFGLALAGLLLLAAALRYPVALNLDTSWYLHAVARFLEGARLYADLIEVNPPLFFYLAVPPIALAKWPLADAKTLFITYVFALSFVSLALSWRLLRRHGGLTGGELRGFLLVSAFVFWLLPGFDFGQREHFAIIFIWPWLLLAALRARGGAVPAASAALIGAFAFFGLAIKPYFLLVPLLIEIWLLFIRRDWRLLFRPENLVLAVMMPAYPVLVALHHPAYFDVIVPMALQVYHLGYDERTIIVLLSSLPAVVFVLLTAHALRHKWFSEELADTGGDIARVFFLAGVAFLLTYFIQHKGWSNHLFVARAVLFPALALLMWRLAPPLIGKRRQTAGATTARAPGRAWAYMGLVGLGAYVAIAMLAFAPLYEMNRSAVKSHPLFKGARSYYAFSVYLQAAFPFTNETGLRWTSRAPSFWLLPGLIVARHELARHPDPRKARRLDAIEKYIRDSLIEDLRRHKPDIIAVDMRNGKPLMGLPRFHDVPFSFLDWLKRDPRFVRIWKNYEFAGRIDGVSYDFYRRLRPARRKQ
ncbi:MAG TPA: hypothetical protein ENK15_04285 [Thermopetrobacter sp.]|nr:hypothetical protein [Thermopetrobacter sp.]